MKIFKFSKNIFLLIEFNSLILMDIMMVLTFTFANDRVSDELFEFYLNEKDRTYPNGYYYYNIGFMKVAYGSFLEGLLVIYIDDLVADAT